LCRTCRLGITTESKVWVGAWWLGFLIFSFVCLLIAVPLIAYPKKLPGSDKLEKVSETHNGDNHTSQAFTKLHEIPKALMTLVKNPTFLCLNLAGASEGLIISGFAVFLPKQIENQYSVTAVSAALLMGEINNFKKTIITIEIIKN
jgi:solute carrier organic anion transporter family, member 4A